MKTHLLKISKKVAKEIYNREVIDVFGIDDEYQESVIYNESAFEEYNCFAIESGSN